MTGENLPPLNNKIIIGLVGEKGAGKGTVSEYLKTNHQAQHFGTSKILKRTLEDLGLPLTRDNLIKLALVLKEGFGATVVIDSLIREIRERGTSFIIIADGIRMHDDLPPFRQLFGPNFFLLYVTADMKVRFERTKARKEKDGEDKMSWQDFIAEEARLTEVSIHEVGRQADFTIHNDGSLAQLEAQMSQIMTEIKQRTQS